MKDLRFQRLERHRVGGTRERMELSYPAPRSPSGKVYQYSPNPDAAPRLFLLGDAPPNTTISPDQRRRILREPGPGQTVCPYSGVIAADDEFVHFEDVEAIKKQILWAAEADVQDYLAGWAKDFNRKQPRKSLISMKMEYKPGRKSRPPLAIREDLLRNLACDVCQRAYAVYAIGLFCPDCGAANLSLHFRREVDLVSEQVALAESQSGERPELAYRLMGNAHEDVLTAFETALKAVYRHLVRKALPEEAAVLCGKKEIGTAFQNVDRAREKFGRFGLDPFGSLDPNALETLRIDIQKRHVIGHNLGLADDHYVELTQQEQPGETVALIGGEVRRFGDLCLAVVCGLEEHLYPHDGGNE